MKDAVDRTYRIARRIAITIVGTSVLLIGVALIVLPGPALIVIPVGLAILSLEFAWARSWLRRLRERISRKSADARGEAADRYRS